MTCWPATREYDAALTDLYTYIRDTGNLQGPDFDAREQRVEQAQASAAEGKLGDDRHRGRGGGAARSPRASLASSGRAEPSSTPRKRCSARPSRRPSRSRRPSLISRWSRGPARSPTVGPGHTAEPTLPPVELRADRRPCGPRAPRSVSRQIGCRFVGRRTKRTTRRGGSIGGPRSWSSSELSSSAVWRSAGNRMSAAWSSWPSSAPPCSSCWRQTSTRSCCPTSLPCP